MAAALEAVRRECVCVCVGGGGGLQGWLEKRYRMHRGACPCQPPTGHLALSADTVLIHTHPAHLSITPCALGWFPV
mgnify:CR=1 FL=1